MTRLIWRRDKEDGESVIRGREEEDKDKSKPMREVRAGSDCRRRAENEERREKTPWKMWKGVLQEIGCERANEVGRRNKSRQKNDMRSDPAPSLGLAWPSCRCL